MTWIAKLGQSIQFVAFFAHAGVAALVVEHSTWPQTTAIGILVLAGIKEFWFDAKYETSPRQTFYDNLGDFAGYLAGAGLGLLLR